MYECNTFKIQTPTCLHLSLVETDRYNYSPPLFFPAILASNIIRNIATAQIWLSSNRCAFSWLPSWEQWRYIKLYKDSLKKYQSQDGIHNRGVPRGSAQLGALSWSEARMPLPFPPDNESAASLGGCIVWGKGTPQNPTRMRLQSSKRNSKTTKHREKNAATWRHRLGNRWGNQLCIKGTESGLLDTKASCSSIISTPWWRFKATRSSSQKTAATI